MDTIYRVKIRYDLDSGAAERGVSKLSQGFAGVASAVVAAAGAIGVSRLAEKIFELGSKAEDARIAIAGMIQAGGAGGLGKGGDDFTKAMGMSAQLMKQMRKDARELPGEFEDLMNVMRMSIGGGLGAGKSINDIEKMSAKVMAFGAMQQLQSEQTGREFAMMMEGRAGSHDVLFKRLMPQQDAQAFNEMSKPEKWRAIEQALRGYEPAIKEFGSTWSAVSSTATDYAKTLFRVGTSPVFSMVTRHLDEWNAYFEKNQAQIEAFATTIGGQLATGLEKGFGVAKDVFGFIVSHKDTLIRVAEAWALGKGVSMLSGGFGGGAADASKFGISGFGAGAAIAAMTSDLTTTGGAINGAMLTVEGGLSRLPGPLGDVWKGLLGFHAALQLAADEVDKQHRARVNLSGDVGALFSQLTGKHNSTAAGAAFDYARKFGAIDPNTGAFDPSKFASGLKSMIGTSSFAEQLFNQQAAATRAGLSAHIGDATTLAASMIGGMSQYDRMQRMGMVPRVDFGAKDPFEDLMNRPVPARNTVINNHVTAHITQTIENANDPDRVLVKTREALESIFRHETVAPTNRFSTVR